jgi:ribosomal protein S8
MFANLKMVSSLDELYFANKKKICESFLKILWDEGFILGYKIDSENSDKIKIFLKYRRKTYYKCYKTYIKTKSIYYSTKQIWKIDSSKSFIIFQQILKTVTDCKN